MRAQVFIIQKHSFLFILISGDLGNLRLKILLHLFFFFCQGSLNKLCRHLRNMLLLVSSFFLYVLIYIYTPIASFMLSMQVRSRCN